MLMTESFWQPLIKINIIIREFAQGFYYGKLAKIPVQLCRLWCISYNCDFDTLTCG